jgi:hypothetical protein
LVSVGKGIYGNFNSTEKELSRLGYKEKQPDDPLFERIKHFLREGSKAYIEPPQEILTTALALGLKNRSDKELTSMLGVSLLSEAIEYRNLQQGFDSCKRTSLLFNSHRLSVRTKKSVSIIDALKDDKYLGALAEFISRTFPYPLDVRHILRAFSTGTGFIQMAYEFPPKVAREYCIQYLVPENGRVLDPCAGWGGRMLGVSTVCRNYTGYEPATETYKGLKELAEFIKRLNPGFNAEVNLECFEDAEVETNAYDMAITSPPYYDTEKYSDEMTNSGNKYKNFDAWCGGFFTPMIDKTMDAIKLGSVFILVIGSRIYDLDKVLKDHCRDKYELTELGDRTLQPDAAIRGESKGETFYVIKKPV